MLNDMYLQKLPTSLLLNTIRKGCENQLSFYHIIIFFSLILFCMIIWSSLVNFWSDIKRLVIKSMTHLSYSSIMISYKDDGTYYHKNTVRKYTNTIYLCFNTMYFISFLSCLGLYLKSWQNETQTWFLGFAQMRAAS